MMDTYLKADSESALWSALQQAGVVRHELAHVDEEGNVLVPEHYAATEGYALDVIGVIQQPVGIDAEDNPIMGAIPGYHANLRGELTDAQKALLPLIPPPKNPVRVWF